MNQGLGQHARLHLFAVDGSTFIKAKNSRGAQAFGACGPVNFFHKKMDRSN
jgi:hypothetical protein